MKRILTLGIAAAIFAFGSMALAYPTLTGPTGQAVIPTALVALPGFTLAADYQKLEDGAAYPIRVLFALGSGAELGGAYEPTNNDALITDARARLDPALTRTTVHPDHAWGVNAKIATMKFLGGASALGAQYRRERLEQTIIVVEEPVTFDFDEDYWQAYLAWTTQFGTPVNYLDNLGLTLGVNWTQVRDKEPAARNKEDGFRGFAGLRINISPSIALEGDIQTKDSDLGDTNTMTAATARFAVSPNITLQAGWTNAYGLRAVDEHNFFAGLAFTSTACNP